MVQGDKMEQVKLITDTIKERQAAAARIRLERVFSQGHEEAIKKLLKGKDLTFIISSRGSGRSYYAKYIDKMAGLYGSWIRRMYEQQSKESK